LGSIIENILVVKKKILHNPLDARWRLSLQVVSGEPAGMTKRRDNKSSSH